MRVLKIGILLIVSTFSINSMAQNSTKIPTEFYSYFKKGKFDQIFLLIDTAGIPKEIIDLQKEKMQTNLTQYGKPKKLIHVIEDENSVKKQFALLIQFKTEKKNLILSLNKNQKQIENFSFKPFNENPFFQLKGYKGFSEVTNLPVIVKTRDGLNLEGNIAFGDTSKQKIPLVIFVHGSGISDRDESIGPNKPFRDLSQGLSQQGIASIRYDKRGFNKSQINQKALDTFDIYTETIFDAVDAIALAKQFSFIDTNKIYIIGHSLGAMCAPKIAQLSPKIKGIILMAGPAKNFIDVLPEQAKYMALLDDTITTIEEMGLNQNKWFLEKLKNPEEFKKIPKALLGGTSYRYWQILKDFDQAKMAEGLNIPMLILNGENDFQVIMEEFELWKTVLKNKDKASFISYPQLNHLFMETIGERGMKEYDIPGHIPQNVIDDIAEFIKK